MNPPAIDDSAYDRKIVIMALMSHIAPSRSPASATQTVGQARVDQPHDNYGFNLFGDPRSFYRNPSQGHT
jgi:hypothetical protein